MDKAALRELDGIQLELCELAQTLEFSDGVRCRIQAGADELDRMAAEIQSLTEERTAWRVAAENAEAALEEAQTQLDSAWETLAEIGDFAHDKSTGPAVPDDLWEIRSMAYTAAEPAISAAIGEEK